MGRMTDRYIITIQWTWAWRWSMCTSVPKGGAYAGWEYLDAIYTARKAFPGYLRCTTQREVCLHAESLCESVQAARLEAPHLLK